jgi:hypothetical protein
MAYQFSQYLDDPEQNPLGGLVQPPDGGADAAPAPPPEPTPAPEAIPSTPAAAEDARTTTQPDPLDRINDLVAQQQGAPAQQPPPFDLAPPPLKQEQSEGPAVLGTILDVLLNKGRNVPQMIAQFGDKGDTDYENWKRMSDYAKQRYALTAPRHGYGGLGSANPLQALLAAERLKQGRQRIGMGLTDEQRKEQALKNSQAHWEDQNTVGNDTALRYEQLAVAAGMDPTMVRGKTAAEIAKLAPSINFGAQRTGSLAEADIKQATNKAASISSATKQDKIDIARAGAQGAQDVKAQPIDALIESYKTDPTLRAHFRDDGNAMRARLQINPRGAQQIIDDIKSNNRALDALDDLSRIERSWKALGISKYAPKSGVSSWIAEQMNQFAPGTPEYDDYQHAAELEQNYHDLMKEVEGVKARIAQSSGSAGERVEAQAAMPGIGNFTASARLSGTRNMLRTNTAANLSTAGMVPDEPGEHEARVEGAAQQSRAPVAPQGRVNTVPRASVNVPAAKRPAPPTPRAPIDPGGMTDADLDLAKELGY